MSDSDSEPATSGTDFQVAIHMYDGPVTNPEQSALIRYCLVGDIDQTSYSYQGDPSRVGPGGTAPSAEQVRRFKEQTKRFDRSVSCAEQWYGKAKDTASTLFVATSLPTEETAKEFLQTLTGISGYQDDWAPLEPEGVETTDDVIRSNEDQAKFTQLLTKRATWIIAICNDGFLRCKAPVADNLTLL